MRTRARIAGALYLVIIATAMFAEAFVRQRLTTGASILAHESLYRLGGAAFLVAICCDVAVAVLFYQLFARVSPTLAALSSLFRLVQVAILGANLVHHYGALFLLKSQQEAAAMLTLRVYAHGFNIALLFFGLGLIFLGLAICKSARRVLGALVLLAGVCYVVNTFAVLVAPAFEARLAPWILLPSFVGELLLALWLLIYGMD
jgi:hypothetical protein